MNPVEYGCLDLDLVLLELQLWLDGWDIPVFIPNMVNIGVFGEESCGILCMDLCMLDRNTDIAGVFCLDIVVW
jgi:hypothetical protein